MTGSEWTILERRWPARFASCAAILAAAGLSLAGGLAGCQKPVLPSDQPRTQFDRFDRVRNQTTPQYVEDEFGRRRPNIGGRLSPK